MTEQKNPFKNILLLFLALSFWIYSTEHGNTTDSKKEIADPIVAKILEYDVPVEIRGTQQCYAIPGLGLTINDTLDMKEKGYVTLIFNNGDIKKIKGPTTTSLNSINKSKSKNIIVKLASAFAQIFFTDNDNREDKQLGVRNPLLYNSETIQVPIIVYPPPGTSLLETPSLLSWLPVEGVLSYSVSLYNGVDLLNQFKTVKSYIELSLDDNSTSRNTEYLWIVEAEVGNSSLHSRQATFEIIDNEENKAINKSLNEIDNTVDNYKLSTIIKAQLYYSYNLKADCMNLIEAVLKQYPNNLTALTMKATLLEELGFYKQAADIYKQLLYR